ncbi:MAG TPA: DNA repair protein RadA [Steroidobacteraceae bacterium]|jgi:DNA repair protein RadA/Sms|nr:DNA repair protein RadA [Steroidobacteraceae bacterium]
MVRATSVFACSACGAESLKWQGQCPQCAAWNSLEKRTVSPASAAAGRAVAAAPQSLAGTLDAPAARLMTGQDELDRVLGGGLVAGSVVLLGGDPGIGKSTLLLQVTAHVAQTRPVLYASGEESVAQVGMRARRLGLMARDLTLVNESDLEQVLALAVDGRVALLVVDSIQTVQLGESAALAGAVTQLRECTARLVRFAKASGTAVVIIGHVTKEGAIAGPRLLEHLVDTVLYFESEAGSRYRLVRATKNRFGAAHELGFFAMSETGLQEVKNPAAIFLARAPQVSPGSIVTVTRDGGRPLLIELQGLVDWMRFGAPRCVAQGLDANRVAMLLAVLSRHAGVSLQEHDVFANVVGGIQIEETAWDLPLMLALASSLNDRPLPRSLVAFGELGLTGELRPVAYGEERLREAHKQGFTQALVAHDNAPRKPLAGLEVHVAGRIGEALAAAFALRADPQSLSPGQTHARS